MTLAEAIAAFEADFTVKAEQGFPIDGTDRLDMNMAPTGDAYVTITSGGEITDRDAMPAWFASEHDAARAWLREVWAYAESQKGTSLYWREPPTLRRQEFVALDQAGLMQDPMMRRSVTINVATVVSRLFVSEAKKSEPVNEEQASAAKAIEDGRTNLPPGSVGRGKQKRH
jgi:hypothetical protein